MGVFSLCFTGISGSGKTTLAKAVAEQLAANGQKCQIIDGDILRNELGNLFGYTREERMKQNRVVCVLAKYLNANHINVIISIVAPYEEMRAQMRSCLGKNYIEAYVECPYEICEKRDVKGYYAKAKKNQLQNLNGVNDVFQVPENPELTVHTGLESVPESCGKILDYLRGAGYAV